MVETDTTPEVVADVEPTVVEENVFRLRTLDTAQPGKYLLTVYHPIPFGVGHRVFLIDQFDVVEGALGYRGKRDDGTVVVEFPPTFNYLLVNRDLYDVIPMSEAKRIMAEAEKEDRENEEEDDDKLHSPGRFTHL